jgi:ABC-type multidrug transport system ATPase subunit
VHAIETQGLTHRFTGAEPVLRDIRLQVPVGSIYGFLGPNGAGKTTTLRLALGLLGLQAGRIQILGQALESRRTAIMRRVGSSIESPSLYSHLSATENLKVWQTVFQCPVQRIPEVLHQVGLSSAGTKPAGQFSLGMKQRLSLAVALLHEPELLILDEPTNGLDPHGIVEMRDLLTALNRDQGTTIVVSSHLLSEVERLVTHVGIINRGELLFQGPLLSLIERRLASAALVLHSSDNARALVLLGEAGFKARMEGGKIFVNGVSPAGAASLNRTLVLSGLDIYELTTGGQGLENIFFEMTGD